MFDRKIMLLAMILVGILTLTAVSAAENATQDIEVINEDIEENLDISHDEILKESSTIAELNTTINDNTASEINLTADYAYTDSDSVFKYGIEITRDLTVNGNGHQIDGGSQARIFHVTKGTVVFKNLTFINGYADNWEHGGAIWTENAHVTAMDCTFNYCTARYGGAMAGGNATNCTFILNYATNSAACGGAMFEGTAINCTFNSNHAETGGAMYESNATNCTFISNGAEIGGAIYHSDATGCTFNSNNAEFGGAAYSCHATNCTFNSNQADKGGAIYDTPATNCIFDSNTASEGGAMSIDGDNIDIHDCTFIKNRATKGGAISGDCEHNNIYNCRFMENSATGDGGAIYQQGNYTNIYNCSFINNAADGFGIICIAGRNISICGCILMENSIGDAVISLNIYSTNKTINNNIFLDNDATIEIYGIDENDTTSNANNNWFGNNETDYSDNPGLTNCNIWLFLDGKTNMDHMGINDKCDITFKLYAYNSTSHKIIEYDNSLLKPLYLTVKSTGGHIDSDTVKLGESITYTETTNETVEVTAQIRSVSQTVEIFFCKKEVNLSFDNQTVDYSRNTIIAIDYNHYATGTLNINLKGKKYSMIYSNVDLNTTISLGNLLPDEYNITIIYSGDDYFLNATVTGKLVISKLDANLKVIGYNINATDTHGVMFNVTLDEGATGNLTLENGTTITVEYETEAIEIFNNAYPVGEYTWTFTYSGDEIYKNSTVQATSNIVIIQTKIIPNSPSIEMGVGDSSRIRYTTEPDDLEGILFESTNESVVKVYNDGTLIARGSGSAEIILEYLGNENYTKSNASVKINVHKRNSTLRVDDMAFDYNTAGSTTVSYTGATGVKASVNDSSAVVEVNGTLITVSNLTAGNYILIVTTIPNPNYNEVTETANITVRKINSTLTVSDITFDYGSSASAALTYTGATGVKAEVVNQPNAVINVNGNTITVSNLDAGTYTLKVTTIADANHNSMTKTAAVTVNKLKTVLTANAITTTYGINKNLVISLKDSTGKPVRGVQITVNLNGAKTYTTNSKGKVTIKTGTLIPKAYAVKIAFKGNANYDGSTKKVKVTVKKAKAKITAKKKTFKKAKKVKKYTITLKANKKPIKKVWVTLKIKGKKIIKAKTNNKGKATFKIKKLTKKGKYKATIKFKGNKYYLKATKKTKITIK